MPRHARGTVSLALRNEPRAVLYADALAVLLTFAPTFP
jgi:hypothetical protein